MLQEDFARSALDRRPTVGYVVQGVDEKTKLKTALQVLRISGLQGYTQPLAETTEEDRVKKALLEALEEVEEEMGIGGK